MPRIQLAAWLVLCTLFPLRVAAHPHEWIDASFDLVFDNKGQLTAIRHRWRLDPGFTAFAVEGLDSDGDGRYSPDELKPLAEENISSLKEFDYFTFVRIGDYQSVFVAPGQYRVELDGDRLMLNFTLPLEQPLLSRGTIEVLVYDPSYYLAVSLAGKQAVRMIDAPSACSLIVRPAKGPSAGAAALLATLGADQRQLPPEMRGLATGIDNAALVNCGGAIPRPTARSALDAARIMSEGPTNSVLDLRALPAAPSP